MATRVNDMRKRRPKARSQDGARDGQQTEPSVGKKDGAKWAPSEAKTFVLGSSSVSGAS